MLYDEFKTYAKKILNEYLKIGYTIEIMYHKGDPKVKVMSDRLRVILKLETLDDVFGDGNENK